MDRANAGSEARHQVKRLVRRASVPRRKTKPRKERVHVSLGKGLRDREKGISPISIDSVLLRSSAAGPEGGR